VGEILPKPWVNKRLRDGMKEDLYPSQGLTQQAAKKYIA